VEDSVDPVEREVVLREVEPLDLEATRVLLLQRRVVVVGEAVDRDDVVAARQERFDELRADEPGSAGDDVAADGATTLVSLQALLPSLWVVSTKPEVALARSQGWWPW
jgi:hypothetical protein